MCRTRSTAFIVAAREGSEPPNPPHSQSYENTPGAAITFDCLASPGLVGKTAQIKEVGEAFQELVTIKKNGDRDIAARATGKGEHNFALLCPTS